MAVKVQNEQIVFRCSKGMKARLKYLADTKGIKLSDLIRNICISCASNS